MEKKIAYIFVKAAYVVNLILAIAAFVGLQFILGIILTIAAGTCRKVAKVLQENLEE